MTHVVQPGSAKIIVTLSNGPICIIRPRTFKFPISKRMSHELCIHVYAVSIPRGDEERHNRMSKLIAIPHAEYGGHHKRQ